MRHICTRCKLTSEDGNLWCQEVDCPAGTLPSLLNFGDFLGDLAIQRLLRNLREAAVYEVQRGKDTFLLKVANHGYEEYLKQEAEAMRSLQSTGDLTLPVWQAHSAENQKDAYGISTFRGETRYYVLLKHVKGEFLSDYLLNNPEPWHKHVGWFMIRLSRAIVELQQSTKRLHLNLNPETIMVYSNKAGIPQPFLLDLGLLEQPKEVKYSDVMAYDKYTLSAYTPPEMTRPGGKVSEATDVYGLGLVMYEMLAGTPAYPYKLRKDEDIRQAIQTRPVPNLKRQDLPRFRLQEKAADQKKTADTLAGIVSKAIDPRPNARFKAVEEFRLALWNVYHDTPDKRPILSLGPWQTAVLALTVLVLILAIVLMLALSAIGTPHTAGYLLGNWGALLSL